MGYEIIEVQFAKNYNNQLMYYKDLVELEDLKLEEGIKYFFKYCRKQIDPTYNGEKKI
jgi:hypothetical protein